MRLALALLVIAGCVPATGVIAEVQGPDGTTSIAAGIATLDFIVAHPSYCGRWVGVAPATHTRVDVSGRDLGKRPYDFMISPSHQTDLSEPVYIAAIAYAADGHFLGEASFDAHALVKDQVLKRTAKLFVFARGSQPSGPKYISADGCACVPGEPWVGTGSGAGCDPRVITSFARLGDTANCELTPRGAPLPVPVCDGQQYLDEPLDRRLPCWAADAQGNCRVTLRQCTDHDGVAYNDECAPGAGDLMLPAGSQLCDRYLACEQDACSDPIGCFRAAFVQKASVKCTLHVDPATTPGQKIRPCPGGSWKAMLPTGATGGTACQGAVLDGVAQPPFTLGFAAPMQAAAQPLAAQCPNLLQIDAIDAPYPAAVPEVKELDLVSGEHLVHVIITVARTCGAEPSLVCSAG